MMILLTFMQNEAVLSCMAKNFYFVTLLLRNKSLHAKAHKKVSQLVSYDSGMGMMKMYEEKKY